MTRPERRSQVSSAPIGLVGALCLIAAVELTLLRHRPDRWMGNSWSWEVTGKEAVKQTRGVPLLAFGDSLVQMGVHPLVIERCTGWKGYNLALGGGQAPASYFLLRRSLDAGARPVAMVVDFLPALLRLGLRHNLQQWSRLLDARECLELCWAARDTELFASLMTRRLLPSVRARDVIRARIEQQLGLVVDPARLPNAKAHLLHILLERRRQAGAFNLPPNPNPSSNFAAWERGHFHSLEPDPANAVFLERFFDLAAEHNIPVYWLVPPIMPGLQAECQRSGFDAEYTAFLRSVQARHPQVVLVDGRRADYDPAVFYDPHHLNPEGARIYSLALAEILVQGRLAAAGGRWVGLPAYRGVPRLAEARPSEGHRAVR